MMDDKVTENSANEAPEGKAKVGFEAAKGRNEELRSELLEEEYQTEGVVSSESNRRGDDLSADIKCEDGCHQTRSGGNPKEPEIFAVSGATLPTPAERNDEAEAAVPRDGSAVVVESSTTTIEFSDGNSKCDPSDPVDNEATQTKNYKNVILEDWEVDTPQGSIADNGRSTDADNLENTVHNNNNSNNVNYNNDNHVDAGNATAEAADEGGDAHADDVKIADAAGDNVEVPQMAESMNDQNISKYTGGSALVELDSGKNDKKSCDTDKDLVKPVLDKKKNPLKYSNLIVSNQDIVDILDNSVERVCRPIMPAKDIFLSIELTKHLNQKLSLANPVKKGLSEAFEMKSAKNNVDPAPKATTENRSGPEDPRTIDKGKEPVDPRDGDESTPSKNDSEEPKPDDGQSRKGKKKGTKKIINIGDEMERTIALRQLRDEFPITRKRSNKTKKLNHIPFLASTVLEKALTSSTTGGSGSQRRRPCYLPDDSASKGTDSGRLRRKRGKEGGEEDVDDGERTAKAGNCDKEPNSNENSDSSLSVVRTYSFKRKSAESRTEEKPQLENVLFPPKESDEAKMDDASDSKPKKQKTVQHDENGGDAGKASKSAPKRGKGENAGSKRRNLELEKLLGDEGAVRMLYDTQHKDGARSSKKSSRAKSTLGLKKDLMLKTKLVKNAVLRLSNVGSDGISLRGNRRSTKSEPEIASEADSSFITSTPNLIFYKPKKKQRAEASRILYRHSSSESFDSIEGSRRMSFDGETLNSTNNQDPNLVNGDLFKEKPSVDVELDGFTHNSKKSKVQRKTKTVGNRLKRLQSRKERQAKTEKDRRARDNSDVANAGGSKLIWSKVPVRKSSRPRVVSKKYSIWSSTSMDSLSAESLGLKKAKKASQEFAKKLNYKELRILQHGSLVQIILATSSTVLKSSFNEQVLTELKDALDFLADQECCNAVLLTSNGSTFCQGIDLNYVLSVEEDDRKVSFGNLLSSLKEFVLCLANFKKPIIAGVQAGAIGLGVTLLPFCDIVVCSDTATFYTPYARLGQMSEGAATVTFPRVNKNLMTELLWKSEKISASEALKLGLVSQIIPEDRFEEELMLLSRRISLQSLQAMQSIKSLTNKNDYEVIEEALELEGPLILEHWCSNECINNIIKFLNSGEVQFRHLDVT